MQNNIDFNNIKVTICGKEIDNSNFQDCDINIGYGIETFTFSFGIINYSKCLATFTPKILDNISLGADNKLILKNGVDGIKNITIVVTEKTEDKISYKVDIDSEIHSLSWNNIIDYRDKYFKAEWVY